MPRKTTGVSGFYGKAGITAAERAEQAVRAEEWHRKMADLDYRQVPVEAPAKMVLALGRLAQEREVPFGEFVESILSEYLERDGIAWR